MELVPSVVSGANGRPGANRETASLVSIASRDSAGGVIWSLDVDSTESAVVSADTSGPRTRNRVGIRRPTSYRAYVRHGRVAATEVDGKPEPFAFNPQEPAWSFVQMLQVVASLPVTGLPGVVGEARTATGVAQKEVPRGILLDSSEVRWTRTGPLSINGTFTTKQMIAAVGGPRTATKGTIEIAFDVDGTLKSAHWLAQGKQVTVERVQ